MKIKVKIARPAPQAYSIKEKYGMALKTAIMFEGKVQLIAVAGGVAEMPSKKPFKKLKSHCNGVKSNVNNSEMFAKTYRMTLKQS